MNFFTILFAVFLSSNVYAENIKPKLDRYKDEVFPATLNQKESLDLPVMVDLQDLLTVGKHQQQRGACSFFAAMGLVEAIIKKDLKLETNLSEEFLIYTTKSLDGVSSSEDGSNTSENLSSLLSHGALLEKDWGYQPGWFDRGLPCANEKTETGSAPTYCYSHRAPSRAILKRVINFENFKVINVPRNLNSLLSFLANEKRPIAVSVPVNFDGWSDSGDVFHNETLRKACLTNPKNCGGHVIVLYGYDLNRKIFYFKNSWGSSWGREGRGTITFDTIDRYAGWGAYSAKVEGEIVFPKDLNATDPVLETFDITPKYSETGGATIKIDVSLNNVGGTLVYISSFLTKGEAHDLVTYPLDLQEKMGDSNVRTVFYSMPVQGHKTSFSPFFAMKLEFPENLLNFDFLKELMNAEEPLYWRTTVYVHNDFEGYKVLKRIFTALPAKI